MNINYEIKCVKTRELPILNLSDIPTEGEPFLLVTDFKWHGIPWFFTHKVYLSNCKFDSEEVSLTFKIIPPEEGEREVISF